MATTAARPVMRNVAGAHDRLFYSTMAIAMALTALVGFAPTYYLKIIGSELMATVTGSPFTSLVHVHGALFTSWVVLFIVQTALVAKHRVAVHRKLGIAGGVLAGAMVIAGVATALQAAGRGTSLPGADRLAFLTIPLFDMLLFSSFVGTALWQRANKEAHKRLMMLAYISILTAAVARLPGLLPLGPLVSFGLTFIFLVAAIVYDWVSRRRVHPAYIWGGSLLVASVPARLAISGTAAWHSFARFLIGR